MVSHRYRSQCETRVPNLDKLRPCVDGFRCGSRTWATLAPVPT